MIRAVDAGWLRDRLGERDVAIIDPRPPVRYLSGHLPRALSMPVQDAFASDGRLLGDDELVAWLGRGGVAAEGTAVVYADDDGQSGAMLAWILEYLGHPDVRFLTTRFEHWKDEGGELFYRPVVSTPTTFVATPRGGIRATRDVVRNGRCLLDTRTREEFAGLQVIGDDPPGHIPGAVNLPHQLFLGKDKELLASTEEMTARLTDVGLGIQEPVVTYCRVGLRASVVWLALHLAGTPARLYDGSFLDWVSQAGAPVETATAPTWAGPTPQQPPMMRAP